MAIYDKNGNEIFAVYDKSGNPLSQAFNKDGEVIYPTDVRLKVMTYNVQWFTGINSQQTMQDIIINGNEPDIIGFQEISKNGTIPTVGNNVLTNYNYKQLSNHVNYIAFASKIPMSNIITADFENQSDLEASQYNETRAYMVADIEVNGKTVKWLNTHLCVLERVVRFAQFEELLDIADGYISQGYPVIMTGDFNSTNALSTEGVDYINMYKLCVDKGYNLANCTTERGFTKTCSALTTASSLSDLEKALDNIIVSSDITILSVVFDTTKFSYLNGSPIDHIPIIATLQVN